MRIGVTGATGFIGRILMNELLAQGHSVRVLVRKKAAFLQGEEYGELEIQLGDITSSDDVSEFCAGLDQVYHLAGMVLIGPGKDNELYKVNTIGTKLVGEACLARGVKRLTYCSSINAIQKPAGKEVWDESCPLALNDNAGYNRTKAAAERELLELAKKGLDVVIVNPTGVIGPEDYRPTLAGQNLLDIYQGRVPATVSGGFNFVDVRDVAQGMISAMEKGRSGERYILGGHYRQLRAMTRKVCEIAGRKPPRIHLPAWSLKAIYPFVKLYSLIARKDPPYTLEMLNSTVKGELISIEKAKQELGYSPLPIEKTLTDTLNWFERNDYH